MQALQELMPEMGGEVVGEDQYDAGICEPLLILRKNDQLMLNPIEDHRILICLQNTLKLP